MKRFLPTKWWSSFLWTALSYIVFTAVLPNLLLLIVNCSGYLPYSDRPGPGWQSPHLPSKDELGFFLGFAAYMVRPTAIYALAFGVIGLLFGLCSLPRWLVRLLGSPLALIAAGFLMMAAGWMIAISALGIYVAAVCGFVWGLLLLPLLTVPRDKPLPIIMRVMLPVGVFAASGLFLVRPFLPNLAETTVTVFVVEQTPLGKPLINLDWSAFGGMPHFDHVPDGRFAPVSLSTFSMSDKRKSRVLLVMSDSQPSEDTLNVPRTGDAIYLESDHKWVTVLKPQRKASFGIKVTSKFGVTADGECCHSGSVQNSIFPPQPLN